MLLVEREFMSTAQPRAAQPVAEQQPSVVAIKKPKPLPPESLKAFGIGYTIVTSPTQTNDEILDRVLGSEYDAHFGRTKPMSLRQLQNEMGIAFRLVSSTEETIDDKVHNSQPLNTGPAFN